MLQAKIEQLKSASSKVPKIAKIHAKSLDKFSRKWKWKMNPTTDGEPSKKEFEGKQYHWCPGHGFWTMHSPSYCNLLHTAKKISGERRNLCFVGRLIVQWCTVGG
jgi:hypothetical protein